VRRLTCFVAAVLLPCLCSAVASCSRTQAPAPPAQVSDDDALAALSVGDKPLTLIREHALLTRPDMCPDVSPSREWVVREERYVERIAWLDPARILLSSCIPEQGSVHDYLFSTLPQGGSISHIGTIHVGRFLSSRYHFARIGGLDYCLFFHDTEPVLVGALQLDIDRHTVREIEPTDELKRVARWQALSPPVKGDAHTFDGPLRISDGTGATLAEGGIPPETELVWQFNPVIVADGDRLTAAVHTYDRDKPVFRHDLPPTDVTILRLPETSGQPCEVLARFLPPGASELPRLAHEDTFEFRSLHALALTTGTRPLVALWEMDQCQIQGMDDCGWLFISRLWLSDLSYTRTLVATVFVLYDDDWVAVHVHQNGSVTTNPVRKDEGIGYACWMGGAFSPDGRRFAYVVDGHIAVVDVPSVLLEHVAAPAPR